MGGKNTNTATPNHTVVSINISKHPNRDAALIHFLATPAHFI